MLKITKISFFSIALIFATNSALIADRENSSCLQVATCQNETRCEKEMSRLDKIKRSVREIIKPGGPSEALDKGLDKAVGKDSFSRKVLTNAFPKIVTVLTTKILVNELFERLSIDPADSAKNGSFANKIKTIPYISKLFFTGDNPAWFGKVANNHKIKDITDILAGAVLGVWLTNK